MNDEERIGFGDAILKGFRLLSALLELAESEVEKARELREIMSYLTPIKWTAEQKADLKSTCVSFF